jgi:hypothetical protein
MAPQRTPWACLPAFTDTVTSVGLETAPQTVTVFLPLAKTGQGWAVDQTTTAQ